jgi:hypothetical protein
LLDYLEMAANSLVNSTWGFPGHVEGGANL